MSKLKYLLIVLLGIIVLFSGSFIANANSYPEETIEIIVPFSVGGGTDTYIRKISTSLSDVLGVSVVVKNIPGAASLKGVGEAYMSEPDGYTLVAFNPPTPQMVELVQQPDFSVSEFTPIVLYAREGCLLSIHPDEPYTTFEGVKEAYNSGEYSLLATQLEGTLLNVQAKILEDLGNINFENYITYDGSGDIIAALLRKEAPVGITTTGAALDRVNSGDLVPLVFLGSERYPGLPDVPSITEFGYEDVAIDQVRVIAGPPGLPQEKVDILEDALLEALESEELLEWAEKAGRPISPGSAEEVKNIMERSENLIEILQEKELM